MSTLQEDYSTFACPNSNCKLHAQFGQSNIPHHLWIGKNKNIKRLRCKVCGKAFSENRATLRERARIEVETQERLLKCFRWGVCDEGTADICQQSVNLFRQKVASHAQKHHRTHVKEIKAPGVQVEELQQASQQVMFDPYFAQSSETGKSIELPFPNSTV